MLKLEHISKTFHNRKIIDDLTHQFKAGEIIAITGPSGCGKSTLLRTLNLLEPIDSGKIIFNNTVLNSKNIEQARKKIGMIFQNFNLFSNMNVIENVASGLIYSLSMHKEQALIKAEEFINKFNLQHLKEVNIKTISGGEKQRVAIARTMAMQPEILLCDEPTSALDPENVSEVVKLLKETINSQMLAIIVTHEQLFAEQIATKILRLDHGKLIEV